MSQRRLRTASLVALFVVTSFVAATACSSGAQHDEVTAGGAAGFSQAPSSLASGGAFVLEAGATSEAGESGRNDEAEAAGDSSRSGQSNGGAPEVHASAGAENGGAPAPTTGGTHNGGATNAGTSGVSSGGVSDAGNSNGGVSRGGVSDAGHANGGTSSGGTSSGGTSSGGSAGSFVEPPACLPASTAPDPAALYLPCEVNTALAVCWHCHGSPAASGTPYSLTTYAQVKAVAGLVYGTVLSDYMPRPPYVMATTDKNALLKWLGKDGTCAVGMKLGCGAREE